MTNRNSGKRNSGGNRTGRDGNYKSGQKSGNRSEGGTSRTSGYTSGNKSYSGKSKPAYGTRKPSSRRSDERGEESGKPSGNRTFRNSSRSNDATPFKRTKAGYSSSKSSSYGAKTRSGDTDSSSERNYRTPRTSSSERTRGTYGKTERSSYSRNTSDRTESGSERKPRTTGSGRPKTNYGKKEQTSFSRSKSTRPVSDTERKPRNTASGRTKDTYRKKDDSSFTRSSDRRSTSDSTPGRRPRINTSERSRAPYGKTAEKRSGRGNGYTAKSRTESPAEAPAQQGLVRLNKYISNAGICSRRDADDLIKAGLVSVNGTVVTEMGFQVKPGDEVRYNSARLSTEKKVYLIMNKAKDTITTLDDPEGRTTVTEALAGSGLPRVYPVGRLDRNTTGVLLLTNDGELAQRLMHPKYLVQKIYKATLNKKFKGEDLWTLTQGIELEDGPIKPDSIAVSQTEKEEVVVEIHSGRNRIIHRMFEHLGYKVDRLDRIWYAGFDKRGLKRGAWREMNDKELTALKKLVKLK